MSQHLAGLQAPLAHDLLVGDRQHAGDLITRSSSVTQNARDCEHPVSL